MVRQAGPFIFMALGARKSLVSLEYWLVGQSAPGGGGITCSYFLNEDICSGNSRAAYFS